MSYIRFCLMAATVVALMSSGAAVSQTPMPAAKPAPVASAPVSSNPTTATRVETWSRKQWEAAKKEWAKDRAKWADCRKQSSARRLEGRRSWSFLHKCMTG
jgi:hypothetical protein